MLTEQEKEQKREARLHRDVEKFKANIAIPRPGTSAQPADLPVLKKHGIELSDLIYVRLEDLNDNPLNEYPPLSNAELAELTADIREKGILIALILKPDGTIVCGHNRKRAGIAAGLERGPAQQILSLLTPELERDIMKSENDRRRGGHWSRDQKEKFILENFGEQIEQENRGGDRKSQPLQDQKLNSPLISERKSLTEQIEKQSRGRISKASAKEIVTKIRKKKVLKNPPKQPDSGLARFSDKERKRGEKLALNIQTFRATKAVLARKMEAIEKQEKTALRELKKIGQPHLFGV